MAYELEGSDEFEELRQFFGAYFHQDWHDEFDDEDDAVRRHVEVHVHLPEDAHVIAIACELDGGETVGVVLESVGRAAPALAIDQIVVLVDGNTAVVSVCSSRQPGT